MIYRGLGRHGSTAHFGRHWDANTFHALYWLWEVVRVKCACLPAQEEATWLSDAEDEVADTGDAMGEEGSETCSNQMDTDDGKADEAYIGMFVLKYVCPIEDCYGTMIPKYRRDSYTCNMCGFQRTEQQFLAAMEQEE